MAEFNNMELREALRVMKGEKTEDSIKAMIEILVKSNLLIPAQWDKEPSRNEKNQMVFGPNTTFNFALATNSKQEKYLVLFTSHYDYKHWDETKKFNPMVLGFPQLLPVIENIKGLSGVVIDPTDVNITLSMDFFHRFKKREPIAVKPGVNVEKKQFKQGEKLKLKDVEGKEDLKNAIIAFSKEHKEIYSVFLKSRIQEEKEHWFLVVEMQPEDPNLFQDLGKAIHPFDEGKQLEFLFASYKIGQQIMMTSKPIYVKESENGLS